MNRDPIVEEVREARAEILADAGGSLDRLVEQLRQAEAESSDPVVTRPPRRPEDRDELAA
jgi:hypothetical protein